MFSSARKTRRFTSVLFVIMAATLLSACASDADTQDALASELDRRGFTDIEPDNIVGVDNVNRFYATAGNCRVPLYHGQAGWSAKFESSRGKENDLLVPEPDVAKLGQIPELGYCFEDEESTDQVEPSSEEPDDSNT